MTIARVCNLWVRANAFAIGILLWIASASGVPALLGLGELLAFAVLGRLTYRSWQNGSFLGGAANMVTWLRLLLLVILLATYPSLHSYLIGGWAFSIFALDGLDGWLARRNGTSSIFGAYFDKELDAFFVMTLSWMCYDLGMAGVWVLLLGLIRYIYLIPDQFIKSVAQADPKFPYARIIAGVVMTGIPICFVLPNSWQAPVLATLLALLCYSFGRSFWEGLTRIKPKQ